VEDPVQMQQLFAYFLKIYEDYTGKQNIVSFSGGKDSTALLIQMIMRKIKIDRVVFADTGVEYPELLEYIQKVQNYITNVLNSDVIIEIVHPTQSWDEIFYKEWSSGMHTGREKTVLEELLEKEGCYEVDPNDLVGKIHGFPPRTGGCWARRDLKVNPLQKALGVGNRIYLGFTKDEAHRSKSKCYIDAENEYIFLLIEWGWTSEDCLNFLREIGLLPPNYIRRKRTGCWCCPQQPRASLKELFEKHPHLWEKLKKYAKDSPWGFGGFLNKPNEWRKRKRYLLRLEREFKAEEIAERDQITLLKSLKVTN